MPTVARDNSADGGDIQQKKLWHIMSNMLTIVRRLTNITSKISSSIPAAIKGHICVLDAIENLIVLCYEPCNNFLLIWMNNASGWDTFEVTSVINIDAVLDFQCNQIRVQGWWPKKGHSLPYRICKEHVCNDTTAQFFCESLRHTLQNYSVASAIVIHQGNSGGN